MADNVVHLLSTLALKGAVGHLADRYQAATGARIDADFAPTLGLLKRLREGEAADVISSRARGSKSLSTKGA
jgi:molybdate transport system substrate-binding protein